jgi:hypothetical protein
MFIACLFVYIEPLSMELNPEGSGNFKKKKMLCQLLPGVVEGVCPSEALPRNGLHLSTVAVPRRQERLHKHNDNHRVRTPSPLHFPFPFYLHTALAYTLTQPMVTLTPLACVS